jgi:hypothetical protein
MGKLDDEIRQLHLRKSKIDFFKLLKNNIGNVAGDKFKQIEKEVKDELFAFIDAQVDMIDSGQMQKTELERLFTEDEVLILKKLANRAANKVNQAAPKQPLKATPTNTQPAQVETKQDKVQFALAHRHLANKEVKVKSYDMASGVVTGVDAPNVIVGLDNGVYVKVLPEDLVL